MANDDCVLTPISLKKCNLGQWKRMMLEISVNGKYTFMHACLFNSLDSYQPVGK
jgi:hypothetical protein